VKGNFWPVAFADAADLNRQGRAWCDRVANVRVHGTTHERPVDRWPAERAALRALPTADRLEVFLWDGRRVARDGYVSWDGTSYGLPWPWRPGQAVQVQARGGLVELWVGQDRRAVYPRGRYPGQRQTHPQQWTGLVARAGRPRPEPHGVQRCDLEIEQRPLATYAALVGG
jgi:hypothetical protein